MPVANASWDLQVASRGRFVLGLGSQVRAHNENRFSVPWSAPAPRMREYVEALRAIWRCWEKGEKLAYRGQHYKFTLMTPNFTPKSTGQPMVPVTIAAVGPAMLRLAGELCDGVRLHGFCTRRYLDEVVLPRAARRHGAERTDARALRDLGRRLHRHRARTRTTVAKMVEWVRYRVAFYGSTPAYWPVLEVHGLQELGPEAQRDVEGRPVGQDGGRDLRRRRAALRRGRHASRLAREIERRFGGVTDAVTLSGGYGVRQDIPPDLIQDIRRIPSAFSGVSNGMVMRPEERLTPMSTSWGPAPKTAIRAAGPAESVAELDVLPFSV